MGNVLVYAFQSRYIRRVEANRSRTAIAERQTPLNAGGSFQIAFGADSVHEYAASSPATESEHNSDGSSFDVEDAMFSVLEMQQPSEGSTIGRPSSSSADAGGSN